ncbi:MAG TPA: LytR family transcriptional regulator, partial [Nocardioides sp.]|nr:LytR family transcriptional regulator [Nocardioides sp.]
MTERPRGGGRPEEGTPEYEWLYGSGAPPDPDATRRIPGTPPGDPDATRLMPTQPQAGRPAPPPGPPRQPSQQGS